MDCPLVSVTKSAFPQSGVKDFAFKGLDVFEAVIVPGYGDSFSLIVGDGFTFGVSVSMGSGMIGDGVGDARMILDAAYHDRLRRRSVGRAFRSPRIHEEHG